MDAFRVEAVDRLVEDQRLGIAEQRAGDPEPLAHAERELAGALVRHLAQTDEIDQVVHAASRDAVRLGQSEQMVVRRTTAVDGARLQQSADLVQRRCMIAVVLAVSPSRRRPSARRAEHQSDRRRLPRPVRAEETGHDARPHRERQIVHGTLVAIVFGEIPRLDQAAKNVAARGVTPAPHENRLTQRATLAEQSLGPVATRYWRHGSLHRGGCGPSEAFQGRIVRVEPMAERHREGLREAAERDR